VLTMVGVFSTNRAAAGGGRAAIVLWAARGVPGEVVPCLLAFSSVGGGGTRPRNGRSWERPGARFSGRAGLRPWPPSGPGPRQPTAFGGRVPSGRGGSPEPATRSAGVPPTVGEGDLPCNAVRRSSPESGSPGSAGVPPARPDGLLSPAALHKARQVPIAGEPSSRAAWTRRVRELRNRAAVRRWARAFLWPQAGGTPALPGTATATQGTSIPASRCARELWSPPRIHSYTLARRRSC